MNDNMQLTPVSEGWGGFNGAVHPTVNPFTRPEPYMPTAFLSPEQQEHFDRLQNPKKIRQRWIWITFQKVGYHRYPQAATDPALQDVSYLGHEHRHLFKFRVQIEVYHDDRELEFHQFLRFCEKQFSDGLSVDHKSCEMISDDLAERIQTKYPKRELVIEVSEDGECGSLIQYDR